MFVYDIFARCCEVEGATMGEVVPTTLPRLTSTSGAFFFMDYEDQLLDPRWKQKRQEIIDRDWGMCQKCMSSKNLDVHHKRYINGRMAWEYDNFYLVTLCRTCHKEEHLRGEIPTGEPDLIFEAFARIKQSVWAWTELAKRSK